MDAHQGGCRLGRVQFVQFDNAYFGLLRRVSHLAESDVGLSDPSFNGMRLYGPACHFTCFVGGQNAAEHKPSVLRQHASVIELQLGVVTADADHAFGIIHCHRDGVPCLKGKRIDKFSCPSVIIGLESFELARFLAVGPGHGLAGGIAREAVQPAVHCEGLQPVSGRKELQIQTCIADKLFGNRLVKPDGDLHRFPLGGDHNAAVEIIVVIAQAHFDAALFAVHFPIGHFRHQIPLFRCVVQTHGTSLDGPYAVLDNLNAGILLVIESAIKTVAENQHIYALPLKIAAVVQFQILCL